MKDFVIHPEIGKVTINRSKRAKRLSVTVRNTETILTIPPRIKYDIAYGFLDDKAAWILSVKKKYKRDNQIILPIKTRCYELISTQCIAGEELCTVSGKTICIFLSQNIESDPSQEIIKKVLDDVYYQEAKVLLPGRVNLLAEKYGFDFNKLSFRRSYTRWGSCSGKNNISLSSRLMKLPDRLIDYVILHELCHTVHKNHGKDFHELLDKVTYGNHRSLNSELRKFSTR
ncbi:MAG: M48 family metallopeptidase [Rikenellaceae bacterium]|nr:M48 family metallopeptidase [Rikenellaceae bacterium]